MISKQVGTNTGKENDRLVSFMNIDGNTQQSVAKPSPTIYRHTIYQDQVQFMSLMPDWVVVRNINKDIELEQHYQPT